MEFAVKSFTLVIDQLECVGAIAVHETVAIGNTTVREQEHGLVGGFGPQSEEVPHHVGILP